MKLSFSLKDVKSNSFIEACNITKDYGFDGIELYNTENNYLFENDGSLKTIAIADSKRKLINRHITLCSIKLPFKIGAHNDNTEVILNYLNTASALNIPYLIVQVETTEESLIKTLKNILATAEQLGITILLETVGALSNTQKLLDVISSFSTDTFGAAWNVCGTFFEADESPEDTIQNLGAYIKYVYIGDRVSNKDVLLGEGNLPTKDILNALRSLNYDGFICTLWNDEIKDTDIVLTHYKNYMTGLCAIQTSNDHIFYNRSHTGSYVWEKYKPIDKTFSQVLDTMVDNYPGQYAFKYTTLDYTRTYSEFRKDVDEFAATLISMGVKPGHHVAIWATNIPQWFITFWATTKIGAVLVTVNTAYKIHEIEYLLRQSDTHTLVMIDSYKDCDYANIMLDLCPELKTLQKGMSLHSKRLPFLRNIITVGFSMPGCLSWEESLQRSSMVPMEEVKRRAAAVKASDVCNMQYTSGTTGFPKGVMLTHRNIINDGKTIGDRMDMSTADKMMIQVPMFHCFGMVLSMTSMMTHGGTLSPLPYFSPKSSLACINNEHITCFNGVPTMFIAMFNNADFAKTDFSYMRTGIMAGSNCPADLMRKASTEMNMKEIISVYGQTESSPGCTMGEVNEDLDHRVETVGSAFPGIECKIIDPETGRDLPAGENGEFIARGYNIMKGYYKMPKATAQTIDKDGWLHTGDICCMTSDGYFKVTGRLKDMIIRGGENLYPREIEEFYLTHPKISDVQVVGLPDERYGEEACAWIILKKGQTSDDNEMREFGNSHIARHKVPRYFMFVTEFPMNAAGKIQKYKMRDESIEKLGLKK